MLNETNEQGTKVPCDIKATIALADSICNSIEQDKKANDVSATLHFTSPSSPAGLEEVLDTIDEIVTNKIDPNDIVRIDEGIVQVKTEDGIIEIPVDSKPVVGSKVPRRVSGVPNEDEVSCDVIEDLATSFDPITGLPLDLDSVTTIAPVPGKVPPTIRASRVPDTPLRSAKYYQNIHEQVKRMITSLPIEPKLSDIGDILVELVPYHLQNEYYIGKDWLVRYHRPNVISTGFIEFLGYNTHIRKIISSDDFVPKVIEEDKNIQPLITRRSPL